MNERQSTPHEQVACTVRRAIRADVTSLSFALARAFHNDPGHRWLFPSQASWARSSHRRFAALLREVLDQGEVTTCAGLHGAALWHLASPPTMSERARTLSLVLRLAGLRTPLLLWGSQRLERTRPARPHIYLPVVGVEPGHQGKGLGRVLLQPMLRHCDSRGLLAYLVCSSQRNKALYQRLGFRITGEIRLPFGPVMWPMEREPDVDS